MSVTQIPDISAASDLDGRDSGAGQSEAFETFVETYQHEYSKAVENLIEDREELMALYDFPAKHCPSIHTTNSI